ncbi:MAG: Wzt carbohydrate-binding domain-containing protein [Acidobacteriia bacterium]|nr:Wzt carbohydrate-binding domain-containing protein [Terriglobia bacterium]
MAIAFRNGGGFEAAAPDGAVVGVIGEDGSGKGRLLREAAARGPARYIGPGDALEIPGGGVLLIEHAFAFHDALARERAAVALHAFRRAGGTALIVSHEENLLRRLCDEIWWLRDGALAARGDPGEILACYRRHIAERVRAWGETAAPALSPAVRRGDGRAEVLAVETIGENGRPTMVWRSGELAVVKVRVIFRETVADPVVGIMIRTRIGLNVYGTNTELERLQFGPCAAGLTVEIAYAFRCELCPGDYTITVASHDPDGVWHDWLEDAVAITVVDQRYTAGVANLRATVSRL